MATTALQFSKNAEGRYEASFVSEGAVTIQMERAKTESINVYANMDGMGKKYIGGYGPYNGGRNEIFVIDVPAGITVTIESLTEVAQAKMVSDEG